MDETAVASRGLGELGALHCVYFCVYVEFLLKDVIH